MNAHVTQGASQRGSRGDKGSHVTTGGVAPPRGSPPLSKSAPSGPKTRRTVKARGEFWRDHYSVILGTVGVIAALGVWQWLGGTGIVDPLFISAPSEVVTTLYNLFASGEIWPHLAISGEEFVIGFSLGIVIGIPIGGLMGYYKYFEGLLNPLVSFMYATPRIALLPLTIIWFGLGLESKIFLVMLGTIFPVLISTITGVKEVDGSLVMAARSFGARDREIFRTIILPSSVPNIITGIRLGLAHALIAVVVAEYFSSNAGVGYIIASAANSYRTDLVFAGVIIIAGSAVLLTSLFLRVERYFQKWKPERQR